MSNAHCHCCDTRFTVHNPGVCESCHTEKKTLGGLYTEKVRCTSCYQEIEGVRSTEDFLDSYKFVEQGLHCPDCVKKIQGAITKAEDADEVFRDFLGELIALADGWPEGAPASELARIVATWAEAMKAAQDVGSPWPKIGHLDQSRRQFPAPTPPVILDAYFEAEHAKALLL